MLRVPPDVAEFLRGRRIAVAGVSRDGSSAANPIFRTLRARGYDVYPVNPKAVEVEGTRCYPDLGSIAVRLDGVVIATHPNASLQVVREAASLPDCGVWFHRSLGRGSVSDAAIRECVTRGIRCITGGCPLMYCEPVDWGHRCLRRFLEWRHRLPA